MVQEVRQVIFTGREAMVVEFFWRSPAELAAVGLICLRQNFQTQVIFTGREAMVVEYFWRSPAELAAVGLICLGQNSSHY